MWILINPIIQFCLLTNLPGTPQLKIKGGEIADRICGNYFPLHNSKWSMFRGSNAAPNLDYPSPMLHYCKDVFMLVQHFLLTPYVVLLILLQHIWRLPKSTLTLHSITGKNIRRLMKLTWSWIIIFFFYSIYHNRKRCGTWTIHLIREPQIPPGNLNLAACPQESPHGN